MTGVSDRGDGTFEICCPTCDWRRMVTRGAGAVLATSFLEQQYAEHQAVCPGETEEKS